MQVCIFVSFEWETFRITETSWPFLSRGGKNGWWAQQRTQCVILGTGGAAHGIPHVVCTADKEMSHCKGCRSPVHGYEANCFSFSFKWNTEAGQPWTWIGHIFISGVTRVIQFGLGASPVTSPNRLGKTRHQLFGPHRMRTNELCWGPTLWERRSLPVQGVSFS